MSPGLLVGVTGAIGAGKTTVCRILAESGRTVLSADLLAREIMESDREVLSEIRSAFGKKIFTPEGLPDRRALADLVFQSPPQLSRLNDIVHPRVFRELDRRLNALPAARRRPYVVVEAALIFETGMDERLDYVVVVHAAEAKRIARVTARDHSTDADVRRRMRAQMPAAQKAELADFLVQNDGGEEDLRAGVAFVDRILSSISTSGNPV